MTLTQQDQEKYLKLAELEEQSEGVSQPGESYHGSEAAAIGHSLLLEALGSEEAVREALGGRPSLGRTTAGAGPSPTIRVRVTEAQREAISALKNQMRMKHDSELVRAALEEYTSRHLKASA